MDSQPLSVLNPDPASLSAGQGLTNPGQWAGLGRLGPLFWGVCRGSADYQVRADTATLRYKCSCPSRKFPCKHVIALWLMGTDRPDTLAAGKPPGWVEEWLAQQLEKAVKKSATAGKARDDKVADPAAAAQKDKRREKRAGRVRDGVLGLSAWLQDVVRHGAARLQEQPSGYFQQQAARLVDAQAPGLAARLQRLGDLPGSGPEWPALMTANLGRLALAVKAFERYEQLPPEVQADVRSVLGYTLSQDELARSGAVVRDVWCVLGASLEEADNRLQVRRTWLRGLESGRTALELQFAVGRQPLPPGPPPGRCCQIEATFYPSNYPQRVRLGEPLGPWLAVSELPGGGDVEALLAQMAEGLAKQPWLESIGGVLRRVCVAPEESGAWWVYDSAGKRLPLHGREHWKLLAVSGARPIDLACQWDGRGVRPLGTTVDGEYITL